MRHGSALVRAGVTTALAFAALSTSTGPARAAPPAAAVATTAHKAPAVELAAGACRLGRWAAAVDLMRVVERQERSAQDWLCLARAEFHTGQWVAALDSYDELAESEAPASRERTPSKERLLQDAEARQVGAVERQELETRLAWIQIVPSGPLPASVKLSLDGEPIARSRIGVAFPVQPGRHAFALEARGVVRELDHWRVAPGERRKVNLSLPPARHDAQQAVTPREAAQRQPPVAKPAQQRSELSRWARGSLYAGGLGASAGIVLLGTSNVGGFHEGMLYTGLGSLVLGGVALLTGAGLYLADGLLEAPPSEAPPEPRRLRVEPWLGANSAGISGSF